MNDNIMDRLIVWSKNHIAGELKIKPSWARDFA